MTDFVERKGLIERLKDTFVEKFYSIDLEDVQAMEHPVCCYCHAKIGDEPHTTFDVCGTTLHNNCLEEYLRFEKNNKDPRCPNFLCPEPGHIKEYLHELPAKIENIKEHKKDVLVRLREYVNENMYGAADRYLPFAEMIVETVGPRNADLLRKGGVVAAHISMMSALLGGLVLAPASAYEMVINYFELTPSTLELLMLVATAVPVQVTTILGLDRMSNHTFGLNIALERAINESKLIQAMKEDQKMFLIKYELEHVEN